MMNVEIKKTEPKLRLKVKKQNIVDIEQTKKFLEVLGGKDDKFTFQTFDDCRDSKRHGLVKQFHGTINEYIDELTQLNKKGAGVFVTVNCTDLKGRTKKNIIGLRALFVDNDTGPLPALKLKPSMVVSSKNGEHAYWVLNEGQPIERFTDGQKTLIHHLNTDKSVHDLPRVMRLPGFLHIKDPNDPFLVVIKENEAVTYTIDEVLEVYPPLKKISSKKDTTDVESGDYDNFKKWADELPAEENTENKYGGRHKTALILVREGLGRKISDEKILQVLHDYCDRSNSEKTTHKFDYEEADEILRTQIAQHNEMPFESFFKKLYFKIMKDGVYAISFNDDGKEVPLLICSKLEILAMTRDEKGENWGRLLRWQDADNRTHHWSMPMASLTRDANPVVEYLLSCGLQITNSSKGKELLSDYLQKTDVKIMAKCVERTGWYEKNYITPKISYGSGIDGEEVLLQTTHDIKNKQNVSGTLEEWRTEIASKCIDNSKLILALCTSASSPLLYLVKEHNIGIHLFGRTSIGKTIAGRIAGSFWGGDNTNKGYLESWRATDNGIEGIAALHNDSTLILDEIHEVRPEEVGKIAYMLANGFGKQRASKTGGIKNRQEWRLVYLSSGEKALSDYLTQAGLQVQGGQTVRMIDIPADSEKGYGIFENIHNEADAASFAKKLETATQKYYGSPIKEYLPKLVKGQDNVINIVQKYREIFNKHHVAKSIPKNASPEIGRVKDRFSFLAASGELAIEYGIFPWAQNTCIDAVGKCFKAWIDIRGTENTEEKTILEQIRGYLQEYGTSNRFPSLKALETDSIKPPFNQQWGVKTTANINEKSIVQWWIFSRTFRNEFCKGLPYHTVNRLLVDKGFLTPGKDGNASSPERISGRGIVRVYKINARIFEE